MARITVLDNSLKQLMRERSAPLLFREKTAVAQELCRSGVDVIELPPVRKPKEDTVIYRTIAAAVSGCTLSLELDREDEDASQAWACIRDAQRPCLSVSLPVSAAFMEYELGMKAPALLAKLERMVKAAAEKCANVEFAAEDAGRADEAFLLQALETAANAGATALTLCDGAGSLLPEDWKCLTEKVLARVKLPLYAAPSDALHLGLAGALEALKAGASGVKCGICGKNCLTADSLATLLGARGEDLALETGLKLTELHRDTEALLKKLGHRDFLSSGAAAGENTKDVFLDSASGLPEVKAAVISLGYDLSEEDYGKVYDALMKICSRKSSVGRRELEAIVGSAAMQVPSTFHLESYSVHSGNLTQSMAQVRLIKNGESLSGVADGDGPIDAAFRALESCVGFHYELDDFQIQAVTEGKESLGSTLVKLRSGGRLYAGNGLSTDIVGASIRAYLNALNKIVFEEQS